MVCKNYATAAVRLFVMSNDRFSTKRSEVKVALFHENVTLLQVKSSLYCEYYVTYESSEMFF